MASHSKSALLLLSGGPDSATMVAWAVKNGISCRALYVRFDQNFEQQRCAEAVAAKAKITLDVIDMSGFGDVVFKSPLKKDLPFGCSIAFSVAVSHAIKNDCDCVMYGKIADSIECEGNKTEFLTKFEALARVSLKSFELRTPFSGMKKHEVLQLGRSWGVEFKETMSCIHPSEGKHCGECIHCQYRNDAFKAADIKDPTEYIKTPSGQPRTKEGSWFFN